MNLGDSQHNLPPQTPHEDYPRQPEIMYGETSAPTMPAARDFANPLEHGYPIGPPRARFPKLHQLRQGPQAHIDHGRGKQTRLSRTQKEHPLLSETNYFQDAAPPSQATQYNQGRSGSIADPTSNPTRKYSSLPMDLQIALAERSARASSPVEKYRRHRSETAGKPWDSIICCGIEWDGLTMVAALAIVLWVGVIFPLYLYWGLRDESHIHRQ